MSEPVCIGDPPMHYDVRGEPPNLKIYIKRAGWLYAHIVHVEGDGSLTFTPVCFSNYQDAYRFRQNPNVASALLREDYDRNDCIVFLERSIE